MDRLAVLDRGRIVEEGDHRSLLAQGGPAVGAPKRRLPGRKYQ
jgi:hypothetical protein